MEDKFREYYQGKKVLITGGLGFIGSNLAIKLVEAGAEVTLIDSMIPEYGGNFFNIEPIKDKVKVNISDVRDRSSMNFLVKDIDCLFNLAGTLSHIDSMRDPFTDLEINCVSQLSILEACRWNNKDVKVVFAGTRGQYGRARYLPIDERHPTYPIDVNGINKIAGELYHLVYCQAYGIKACSLRLTNTYGPRHQMRHPRQGILNWFLRLILDNQTIKIYGDGKQIRDSNYVDDVVDAFLLAMMMEETNGEVYNIGGIPISLIDFIKKAIDIYGSGSYEFVPFPQESKIVEVGDYIADYTKFSKLTGWQPKTSLEEGISRTIEYYKKYRQYYWD